MLCPSCNLEQPTGNRFCEDCGARLDGRGVDAAPSPVLTDRVTCRQCGAINSSADGYCPRCGFQTKSLIEDHVELSVSPNLAGVSDRGKVRARNEDCVALAAAGGAPAPKQPADNRTGDSPDLLMRQLTVDHSWVNLVVASGELSLEQAMHQPNAHAITRTLGGPVSDTNGEAGGDEPSVLQLVIDRDLERPGWLMLCTDGFWDSHENISELSAMVIDCIARRPAGADTMSLARDLVDNAVRKRGHDNTTVALLFVGKEFTV